MYLREPQGLEWAGAAGGRSFGRAVAPPPMREGLRERAARADWAPDLGTDIGSRTWWRGVATFTALCVAAWALSPGIRPLPGYAPPALTGDEAENARALAVAPLGEGANTGRRMAANDLVVPLAEAPERPVQELTATLGEGDAFASALSRAGVGGRDAADASAMVAQAVSLGDIRPGTRIDLTLGRRPNRMVARPLEKLAFRARFDLNLSVSRAGDRLQMTRQPIAIDHTPLRIQGLVGSSLYRSARAAGAPAQAVEDYLKAMATKISIGQDVAAADRFDLVIEQARAATGEVQTGRLLLAGLAHGGHQLNLIRWKQGAQEDWFDGAGQVRHAGAMEMPVAGRITSAFGWRFHPILGFARMHKGVDIAAPFGTAIEAAIDGVVRFAGWHGGHGNFVELGHQGNVQTGYGHMSRIAVRIGEHVRRGQVIGYIGMTGLTTGPHLHWEVYKNGVAVNPMSINYASTASLPDADMQAFKARVAELLAGRATP